MTSRHTLLLELEAAEKENMVRCGGFILIFSLQV